MKKDLQGILLCPKCKAGRFQQTATQLLCRECQTSYPIQDGKYLFRTWSADEIKDPLDRFKHLLKKFDRLYNLLNLIVGPVCPISYIRKFLKDYASKEGQLILNLGSGNSVLRADIINVDIFAYPAVDLTCDIENLPIQDNSVDVIVNTAVLEHVPRPEKVVAEIRRVLKKGGMVYSLIPFIQGFHASPHDYARQTFEGMKVLFKDFELVELKPSGGPTSGALWVLQEWLALVLSFSIRPLYQVLYLLIMVVTFPLKFLDFLLIRYPMAKNISSSFVLIGRNP